ncbi:MAG: U32 family peptidase [Fusobacteriaceae bacterium]|nr:U32 family peptidase [Fusobacteriaceae bacterium]
MKIVAPAGNGERLRAAVNGGADEVYMGLKGFGARRHAENFSVDEFAEALDYAHRRGAALLLTLNTLMSEKEMEFLYANVRTLYEKGLDAVIVQDLGLYYFLRRQFPDLPIHASTQMAVGNHAEANFLKSLGFSRVILPRELSFKEIRMIRQKTDMELEVFVSGSLCICHSGKCYMSSFIGGRSGNRGLCAQPCRKLYMAGDRQGRLLSPRDQLLGPAEIKSLVTAGVDSVKIEGRMKDPEWVYTMVRYYRDILDGKEPEDRLPGLFHRDYDIPYFHGISKNLINRDEPPNLGREIARKGAGGLQIIEPPVMGDGVIFLDEDRNILGGSYVNKNLKDMILPPGTKTIRRNYDKALHDRIAEDLAVERRLPAEIRLTLRTGEQPLAEFSCAGKDGERVSIGLRGTAPLRKAQKRSVSEEELRAKFAELGNTNFYMQNFILTGDPGLFFPFSEIKELKRKGIEALGQKLSEHYDRTAPPYREIPPFPPKAGGRPQEKTISAIVRNNAQLKAAVDAGIKKIYRVRDAAVGLALEKNLEGPDKNRNIVFNLYELTENKAPDVTLHWMFNITNRLSVKVLYDAFPNIGAVILSPELSLEKIKEIGPLPVKKALTVYSKLRAMTIEADLFRGREQTLTNEQGDEFTVIRNDFHNTELYFAKPLNLLPILQDRKGIGPDIDEYVIELTDEDYETAGGVFAQLQAPNSAPQYYNYLKGVY